MAPSMSSYEEEDSCTEKEPSTTMDRKNTGEDSPRNHLQRTKRVSHEQHQSVFYQDIADAVHSSDNEESDVESPNFDLIEMLNNVSSLSRSTIVNTQQLFADRAVAADSTDKKHDKVNNTNGHPSHCEQSLLKSYGAIHRPSSSPPSPHPAQRPSMAPTQQELEAEHKGFREDYELGDTARSPTHMIQNPPLKCDLLKKHDFAWIKRSDGSYSYAILAFRSYMVPTQGRTKSIESYEEYMTFCMSNSGGSTKMIPRRRWGEFVRLVSTEDVYKSDDERATKR